MREIDWVLDHHADVTSDLSAIHGIRDYRTLDAATFFALAYRLVWHQGAVRGALQRALREEKAEQARVGTVVSEDVTLTALAAEGLLEH